MFRFEKLEIWSESVDILDNIFDLADELTDRKYFRFAEQLRSSVLSVSNNIAEGSGSSSIRDFQNFLNIAHRSVFETANMVIICSRRSLITEAAKTPLLEALDHNARKINRFSASLIKSKP